MQWRAFVAESVTPRFPGGFTELQAQGHWRDGLRCDYRGRHAHGRSRPRWRVAQPRARPRGGCRLQTSIRAAVGADYARPSLSTAYDEANCSSQRFVLRSETDQAAIRTLVHSERLNPHGLDWPNFMVAVIGPALVGAVQLRRHLDGSRELGSLVVRKEARRRGIASRLINALLAGTNERMLLITVEAFAARYERWGFRRIEPDAAPAASQAQYRIGSLVSVTALLQIQAHPPARHSRIVTKATCSNDATRSMRVPKRLAFDRALRQARA